MTSHPKPVRIPFIPDTVLTAVAAMAAALAFASSSQAAATEEVQNLNDSGAGSLRQAITDVDSGGTITFKSGLEGTITLESELTIDKSVTIEGPGADAITLDGQAEFRHFLLGDTTSGIDVDISGLRLFRGYTSGDGGSIASYVEGSLDLSDIVFRSNTSDGDGGALYLSYDSSGGDVTLDNIYAIQTAADGDGGVIYSDSNGKLSISNSEFRKNAAYGYAGFLYLAPSTAGDTLSITDTAIVNNGSTDDYAGAVYFDANTGNVTFENNLWERNYAYSGYGGAIYNDTETANHTITDTGSAYLSNISTDYAGAIYSEGTTAFTFEDAVFDGNNSGTDEGGALSLNSTEQLTIKRSVFTGNTDQYYGAVIDLAVSGNRDHVIEDTSFVNSSGGNSYSVGGLNLDDDAGSTYALTNVTVAGNVGAGDNSAAIDISEGDATLDHVTVANNTGGGAGSSSSAAGLVVDAGNTTMRNSIIAGNVQGGGIGSGYPQDCYVAGGANLTLEGANIIGSDTSPTSCPYAGPAPLTGDAGLEEDPVEVPFLGGDAPGFTYVLPLKADSRAIDAATGSSPALDGRGVPRPQLAAADLGAYEWAPTPTVKIVGKAKQRRSFMKAKISCGNTEKGCTVNVQGYRPLKDRVNPVFTKAQTVNLSAGQSKTVKLKYTKKMKRFVKRGLKKKGKKVNVYADVLDTATYYDSSASARVK